MISCPVCQFTETIRHGTTTCIGLDDKSFDNIRRELYKCLSCGSITVHPKPSSSDLEKYYNWYSKDGNHLENSISWRKRLSYQTVFDICKKIGGGKVLDVGCADGELLSILPSFFQKSGIDISKNNRNLAEKKGVVFLYSSLNPAIIPDRFDLILALDFIEHAADIKETINAISRLLVPGGYVVIETGNADSFYAKFLKEDWPYTAVYGHLCVLTPKALSKLALEAGIHEVSIKKGWHSPPSLVTGIFRNILTFGFHAYRAIYRCTKPPAKRFRPLKKLYHHAPPGASQPDHLVFVGQKGTAN